MLGPPRALQRLAVLAVVASPALTLLGAALGVLLQPAPHSQVGLAMQVHFWEAPCFETGSCHSPRPPIPPCPYRPEL